MSLKKKTQSPRKSLFAKAWHFLWHDNSPWSWVANIILAFILIKFILYPGLSFALNSQLPIVAVVSGSMEHKIAPNCLKYQLGTGLCLSYASAQYDICGHNYSSGQSLSFKEYWSLCGKWYESRLNVTESQFDAFPFSNGFNTGDIMVVYGKKHSDIVVGDVLVWRALDGTPIIHRVVSVRVAVDGSYVFATKGDHNADQITSSLRAETAITSQQVIGVAVFKIPFVGYVKIMAAKAMGWVVSLL